MKLFALIPLTLLSVVSAFRFVQQPSESKRHEQVHSIISSAADSLRREVDTLMQSLDQQAGYAEVRLRYERVRKGFRSVDFLIEYVDPTYVTQFLNGAPLPKLDAKSQFVDVLEPQGFQVIDEQIGEWAGGSEIDIAKLRPELVQLQSRLLQASAIALNTYWTDRMILEACRSGVVRFTTMGITGFDRPGTGSTLQEYTSWAQTTSALLDLFGDDTRARKHIMAAQQQLRVLRDSICLIPDSTLDKVELIRNHLEPIFREIGLAHSELGIEYSTEISPAQPVLNPKAQSMFSESFFNAAATSGLHYKAITTDIVDLGRILFFDPILSHNGERACASCHVPSMNFTDGYKTSRAYDKTSFIRRNAPTIVNAVFSRRFFYDFRAMRLSDLISHVITDTQEFNSTLLDVVGRIQESDEYVTLFERAFASQGKASVSSTNVNLAISAFLTSLVSMNSRVDRYLRGESAVLTAQERHGMNLFMGKALCATCHFPPTFSGYVPPAFVESESEIIGVPQHKAIEHAVIDPDIGRAGGILREQSAIYVGSFKTPTVRNVALTAPYFHNGAYSTLADVVDFYVRGGGNGIGLDLQFQTLPFSKLDLNDREQDDIVAFMKALTDTLRMQPPQKLPRHPREPFTSRAVSGTY